MGKLHRIIRWIPLREERVHSLWVSALDGSKMREVGHVPGHATGNGYPNTPSNIQWLPGDKSLSYIYNNRLYVVPVD